MVSGFSLPYLKALQKPSKENPFLSFYLCLLPCLDCETFSIWEKLKAIIEILG